MRWCACEPHRSTLDFAYAATVGMAYLTACVGLVVCGSLRERQWVLVHGAGGGVGLAAVDLAQALGARVIAGSASADKLAVIAAEYALPAIMDIVWEMLHERRLKPRVHKSFALDEWRAAFALMEDRQVIGKVVLCP